MLHAIACSRRYLFLAILTLSPAAAQVSASLTGTVTDQTGAGVPAAKVSAKNAELGTERSTVSDSSGRFELRFLTLGSYEVQVAKEGFNQELRTGVNLAVGQDAILDFRLKVGPSSQQITVSEDAPVIDPSTADVSGLVGGQQVRSLPLNGRSYDLLLTLNPGVVNFASAKTGGVGVSNSTAGNNFAVSGNRPQQNLFLLNGVEFTGAAENNMQPGGVSQLLLGVDAVREFNVLRSNYGAEYGKRPGAQVAIVTQGGSNQFHGSV